MQLGHKNNIQCRYYLLKYFTILFLQAIQLIFMKIDFKNIFQYEEPISPKKANL